MLPEWIVVGFSGHRSIADSKVIGDSISAALDDLASKCGAMVAVSSLAKGSDTLFVEEVVERKIPFLLVLPFPSDRFQQDFEAKDWQRVTPLLAKASHREEVSGTNSPDEAYMETGALIVDRADVVIAVWDGKPSNGLGGTGDVVDYSRALGKPLKWIDATTGGIVTERFESLPKINASVAWSGNAYQTVEEHFRELDEAALLRAPAVRHLLQRIVLLHLTASAAGLVALALHIGGVGGYLIALLEVGVLASAFILTAKRHRRHAEWMKTRIEAEICRSFLATWPMRSRVIRTPKLAIQGFERFTSNLRLLQQMDGNPTPALETACSEYLEGRVQHQIDYFGRRCQAAQGAYRKLKAWAMTSTAAAATLAAAHFALSLLHIEGPAVTLTGLLSLILPLVSAALFSLILTQEHSRRASRYREMVSMLEEAAQQLKAVRTWNGLTRIAADTEEQLLNEAVEWHSFRRFATEPH